MWRASQGLRGLAGLRGDAPSAARGAGDERAGRPCGARNKGDAARIDQAIASDQALLLCYQATPPATGTAARPSRPRVGFWLPDPGVAHGHRMAPSRPRSGPDGYWWCSSRDAPRRWREGIRMGPARKDRPHCCRRIEPAGETTATCRPGSVRRRSFQPSRPGRRVRSRAPREDRRWCGRSRRRERRAASERHRADRQASCHPS